MVELPKSLKEVELTYQSFQSGVERWYFWLLDFVKENMGYEDIKKISEKFMASEGSTFWVTMEQRKATQQEKAAQYLGTVGGMIKSVFQIIRELRIMDERWDYYTRSKKGDEAAEIALKALWVDMVEGGGKNINSVTGLSTQVGFVTLPDFFYSVHPKSSKDVSREVEKVDSNPKLKEVLKRKLFQYLTWKEHTEDEISKRRKFVLASLRQHFNTINLYVSWIKPFLRNVAKLQPAETGRTEELITAAEGAIIDLELFAVKWQKDDVWSKKPGDKKRKMDKVNRWYQPVIQVLFHYRTVPEMMFQQEYQRAPIHVGKTIITFKCYVLTRDQIDEYQKKEDKETMDVLTSMDASLDALRGDIDKYLKEADATEKTAVEKAEVKPTMLDSFLKFLIEPLKGMFSIFLPKKKEGELDKAKAGKKKETWEELKEKVKLEDSVKKELITLYETFRKANGMLTW